MYETLLDEGQQHLDVHRSHAREAHRTRTSRVLRNNTRHACMQQLEERLSNFSKHVLHYMDFDIGTSRS